MRHEKHRAPTLLLTGSNGQVGFELRRSLAPLGHLLALDRIRCDVTRSEALRKLLREVRPDVIVNAAAYTDVNRAESEAGIAFAVNAVAPGVLAQEARDLGSLLVHYSSDYVFDGRKAAAYVESDAADPQSVYGKSKLAGEQAIASSGATAVVLRTSWVAGAHGRNFARTILQLAREQDSLQVVADQFGAPTTASLVADITAHIIARHWFGGRRGAFPAGVYHLAAGGETSWHGYARMLLSGAAARGVTLRAGAEDVRPVPASAYPQLAPRPANSRLDTTKLRDTFDLHLPGWEQGIGLLLDQLFS